MKAHNKFGQKNKMGLQLHFATQLTKKISQN